MSKAFKYLFVLLCLFAVSAVKLQAQTVENGALLRNPVNLHWKSYDNAGLQTIRVYWDSLDAQVGSDSTVALTADSLDITSADISTATNVYFFIDSTGAADTSRVEPASNEALIGVFRFKTTYGADTLFYFDPTRPVVKDYLALETKYRRALPPVYVSGLNLAINKSSGKVTVSSGTAYLGGREVSLNAAGNTKLLLDNETTIDSLEAITEYANGSTIGNSRFVKILLGRIATDSTDAKVVAIRQDAPPDEYQTLTEALLDSAKVAPTSFGSSYKGVVIPLAFFAFEKGDVGNSKTLDIRELGLAGGFYPHIQPTPFASADVIRDTVNAIFADSLTMNLSETLTLLDSLTLIVEDSLGTKATITQLALRATIAALEDTAATKATITQLNLKLDKSAVRDSANAAIAAMDSTDITNDAIGFEDVNQLPEQLALRLLASAARDTVNEVMNLGSTGFSDDSLFVYLPLDDNAEDISGNNRDFTISGGVSFTTNPDSSVVNGAAYFDGSGFLYYVMPTTIDSTWDITLSARVLLDSTDAGTHPVIFGAEIITTGNIGLYFNPRPSLKFVWFNGEGDNNFITYNMPEIYDNTYHYIEAKLSYTDDCAEIWVDGVLKTSDVVTTGYIIKGQQRIGLSQNINRWKGLIDEVKIYLRKRTDAETRNDYLNPYIMNLTKTFNKYLQNSAFGDSLDQTRTISSLWTFSNGLAISGGNLTVANDASFADGGVTIDETDSTFTAHQIHITDNAFYEGLVSHNFDGTSASSDTVLTARVINIDASGTTSGDIHGYTITKVGGGLSDVVAVGVTDGVSVIHQLISTACILDTVWKCANGTENYISITDAAKSTAIDSPMFASRYDSLFIGSDSLFNEVEITLETESGKTIEPTFFYSTGTNSWLPMLPIDGTDGLLHNGKLILPDLSANWAKNTVNGAELYYIKIVRNRVNVVTTPVLNSLTLHCETLYNWDDNASLSVKKVTSDTINVEVESVISGTFSLTNPILPNLDVSFGSWQGLPNYLPTDNDTLEVIALYDSIATKFVPAIKGMHPDTGSVIQELYVFSEVFDIPPYYTGVDSVVFEYQTGNASTDSSAVAVIIYEYTDGALTSLDNTSAAASLTWAHDATLTSLTDLVRYDKFVIAVQFKSMRDYCWAKVGRIKIYWKEAS